MLMDRDRQRRMQQQQQMSANGGEGVHSPYSGARSQVSGVDGRPLMRPITPLKSS